jgi:plasmid stability protein
MASITIRRLDDAVKARLRIRAARHGRSMEEEARQVPTAALKDELKRSVDLAEAIRPDFAPWAGSTWFCLNANPFVGRLNSGDYHWTPTPCLSAEARPSDYAGGDAVWNRDSSAR